MALSPDPYNDGYAFVVELLRPASAADVAACEAAQSWWLEAYEDEERRLVRNTGFQGEPGATKLVIWADRINDPGGPSEARSRASSLVARLEKAFPGARVSLRSADDALDEDLLQRLGTAPIRVAPQGGGEDLLRGELKPTFSWLSLPLGGAWLVQRLAHSGAGAMVVVSMGLLTLVFLSRARTSLPLRVAGCALAAVALLEALALAAGVALGAVQTVHWVELAAIVAWGLLWSRSAPERGH